MYKQRPRIIPVLLLSEQNLVKTKKFRNPTYLGDPVNAVKIFNEKCVDELCILDISATKNGKGPDINFLKTITSEAFMPLSYGGGINTIEEIKNLLHIGFEKIVLNTSFSRTPSLVKEASLLAGRQSIIVSIDAKKGFLGNYSSFVRSGNENIHKKPSELALAAENLGAGEILLQSIDQDGRMLGYDDELIRSVTSKVRIPVIACGGAGTLKDLKYAIYEDNAHAAAAGSVFVFFGKKRAVLINYPTEKELEQEGIYI